MIERRSDLIADRRAYPRVAVDTGEVKERRRGRPTRSSQPADQRTPVYLTGDEKRALEDRAARMNMAVSELIREAIDDYLDDIGEPTVFSSTGNSRRA